MKKRIMLCLLCCILLMANLSILSSAAVQIITKDEDIIDLAKLFEGKTFTASDGTALNYRIFLPADYSTDKEYPLILFMHGAGERGNDNQKQLKTGICEPFRDKESKIYQCIVLAPQCPTDKQWVNVAKWTDCEYSTDTLAESAELKAAIELFEKVKQDYSVDPDRVYATGLSMGGYATWDMAVRHPELFAAIMPLCGGADNSKASILVDMPIWTFHGDADPTVPIRGTSEMVNALRAAGSTLVKYTVYEGETHNIWTTTYGNEEIYTWLLSHKLSTRIPPETEPETEPVTEPVTDPVTDAESTTEEENTSPASDTEAGCKSSVGIMLPLCLIPAGFSMLSKKKKAY